MYRNIHSRFWTDPKIRKLSVEQRYLFLYLVTNEHSHVAGIYHLPKLWISHETGLSGRCIDNSFQVLQNADLAHYDSDTEQVWIVKMLCYQGAGSRITASVMNHLNDLHESKIKHAFAERYSYPIDNQSRRYHQPIDGLTVPVPVPFPVGKGGVGEKPTVKNNGHDPLAGFDEFISKYPRQDAIPRARAAWKAEDCAQAVNAILADVETRKHGSEWNSKGGRFIPKPANYLSERRWEDKGVDLGEDSPECPKCHDQPYFDKKSKRKEVCPKCKVER